MVDGHHWGKQSSSSNPGYAWDFMGMRWHCHSIHKTSYSHYIHMKLSKKNRQTKSQCLLFRFVFQANPSISWWIFPSSHVFPWFSRSKNLGISRFCREFPMAKCAPRPSRGTGDGGTGIFALQEFRPRCLCGRSDLEQCRHLGSGEVWGSGKAQGGRCIFCGYLVLNGFLRYIFCGYLVYLMVSK